jgi:hypothetical protein
VRWLVVLAIAGCGSSEPTNYDCLELSKRVTQERGTCRVAIEPTDRVDLPLYGSCVSTQDAYCGDETNCPSGWSLHCENGTTSLINCLYGTGKCYAPTSDVAAFDFYQVLDGRRGMGIVQKDGRCKFRLCEPL